MANVPRMFGRKIERVVLHDNCNSTPYDETCAWCDGPTDRSRHYYANGMYVICIDCGEPYATLAALKGDDNA